MGRGAGKLAAAIVPPAACLLAIGCTTVPAPVISPFPVRRGTVALTHSVGIADARAEIRRPDGTTQVITGNGEHSWGQPGTTAAALLAPAIASWQGANADWDGGPFLGWRRLGATARRRLLTTGESTSTSLAFATNLDLWGLRAADASLALEQTLPLAPQLRVLVRLGVDYGRRRYDVQVPFDLDPTAGHDNTIGAAHVDLYRFDGRVDAVVGLALGASGFLTLTVQPYFVVLHGAPQSVSCVSCVAGVELLDFALSSGFAFAITYRGG